MLKLEMAEEMMMSPLFKEIKETKFWPFAQAAAQGMNLARACRRYYEEVGIQGGPEADFLIEALSAWGYGEETKEDL